MFRKIMLLAALVSPSVYAASKYEIPSQGDVVKQPMDVLDIPVSLNVRNISATYLFSLISDYVSYPIVLRDIDYPDTAGAGQTTRASTEYMTVSYFSSNKKLKHTLDEITGMLDLWWKKEDDRIVIYKYEQDVFHLSLPFLIKKIDEKSDSLTLQYQREFIKEIDTKIQSVLKDKNSKVSVDEMGNVYVSARKSEMRFIQQIVKGINERFTKEIPLKLDVYIAREGDLLQAGILFSYDRDTKIGGSTRRIQSNLNASAGGIFDISVLTPSIKFKIDALAQDGKLISVENTLLQALNGQPIYYSPVSKTRIVSKFNLTFINTVGDGLGGEGGGAVAAVPTIEVETEDIQSGSTLILVPYFIGNNDSIAIDFYRKYQTLESIKEQIVNLQGNENKVALPELTTRTNLNQTILKKNQSLVLFSTSFTAKEATEKGIPFFKDIPVLGNLFKHQSNSDTLYRVIMVISYLSDSQTVSKDREEIEKMVGKER